MNTTLEEIRDAVYAKDFEAAKDIASGLTGEALEVAETFIRDHQKEAVDFTITHEGVKLRVIEKNYDSNGAPGLVVEVAETIRVQPDEYEAPETHYAGECWSILTVNLPEARPRHGEFFIKTWEEHSKGLRERIFREGPFEKTGETLRVSPWAEVEVWRVK